MRGAVHLDKVNQLHHANVSSVQLSSRSCYHKMISWNVLILKDLVLSLYDLSFRARLIQVNKQYICF